MAKNSLHNDQTLIAEIARPFWDRLIKHNLKRHPERVVDANTLMRRGVEEFRFTDFCDEVRLELMAADAKN